MRDRRSNPDGTMRSDKFIQPNSKNSTRQSHRSKESKSAFQPTFPSKKSSSVLKSIKPINMGEL